MSQSKSATSGLKTIGFSLSTLFAVSLTGPITADQYIMKETPGLTPEKFAPDVVSTDAAFELNAVFSNDGKEFFFTREINKKFKIFSMHRTENGWSIPEMVSFSKTHPDNRDADMMFSPDGSRLYFISDRPLEGYPEKEYNLWYVDRAEGGWGVPKALSNVINTQGPDYYPAIVGDGSLYYTSDHGDSLGSRDSYRAQYVSPGIFEKPVNLGPNVNSKNGEGDIFVSPDEDYLIHVSYGRTDDMGRGDLYISFKQTDGSWGKDIHMGDKINSDKIDFCPMVTPDGKYFFYSQGGDVFWVDAKIIDTFRPQS
ncbi:hypothetical protein [Kordiimonas sp. SCSIO 12610]|uniref:hypothetical protein n=1 Tax=Kordiimonas sp. SCSIO 12610 TaxID=2829597 RepID=UPI002108B9DD|nr:hypothetical protein [Kordiimonas sp. SCSIO 12610]UTW54002.1 PD40 domain-containing protein [Kordiimonas sp. SCSIO 12610]